MSRAQRNSEAALEYARKKKEQMERARRLREERKMKAQGVSSGGGGRSSGSGHTYADFVQDNAKPGAQIEVNGYSQQPSMGYGNDYYQGASQPSQPSYGRPPSDTYQRSDKGYGSSNYRPNSNEEITEARQSLVLLKSKIKNKTTNE